MKRRQIASALVIAATLPACAGGPRTAEDVALMRTEELLEEINSPAARSTGYARYDSAYRPRLIVEVAKRLQWTESQKQDVLGRKIWIGATRDQLVASWGSPRSSTRYVSRHGISEFWHYGTLGLNHTSVCMDDGVVASWSQDH